MAAVVIERPDGWNFPLLLHVAGAMLLVGSLVLVAATLLVAWRDGSAALLRSGARALILGVIPSYLLMRLAAEWIADKEGVNDIDPTPSWVDIGYQTADTGSLLIIVAAIAVGIAVRRQRRGASPLVGLRIGAVLVSILIAAFLVAVWAMTTKPT